MGTTAWTASTTLRLDAASSNNCLVGGGLTCNKKFGFDGETGVVGKVMLLATLIYDSFSSSDSDSDSL